MLERDVAINKQASIERCVNQIKKYMKNDTSGLNFEENYLLQDAIALNLQRICDLCIDLANVCIKHRKLGVPNTSADSFKLLLEAEIIDDISYKQLRGMVGFRNILIHEYTHLDKAIFKDVIENHLNEPIQFAATIIKYLNSKF